LRQSSDHEDSEGEPQVYGQGITMEENRNGQSTSKITTIPNDDAPTPCKSIASAEVQPSPRQAYGDSDSCDSVA
jgi:hypothetical protein